MNNTTHHTATPTLPRSRFLEITRQLADGDLGDPVCRKVFQERERIKQAFISQKNRQGKYPGAVRFAWPRDDAEIFVSLTLPSYLAEIAKRPVGVVFDHPVWTKTSGKQAVSFEMVQNTLTHPRRTPQLQIVNSGVSITVMTLQQGTAVERELA